MNIRNRIMVLITKEQYEKLTTVGHQNMVPVIKLFGGSCFTWLVTEIDPDGILWGFADIGQGQVEFGTLFHVSELAEMRFPPLNTYLERDRGWQHKDGAKYLDMESLTGI